jgi:hypothetical protein
MNFDHGLLKDLICEKNPSTTRKNIIFENVYGPYNGYIMAPYRTLIWSNNFSVSIDEYESRLKQKEREIKLNNLVC